MRAKLLYITLLLLASVSLNASEVTIVRERSFEGDALYGYMNGGSDLYFEYGFRKLTVRDIKYEGFSYTVELFQMDSPKNAYGIYSIQVFKPIRVDSLVRGGFDALSKYVLLAAMSDRYISITFNDGPKASRGADFLMKELLQEIEPDPSSSPSDFFPEDISRLERPFSGRLKYIRGPLGLANADDSAYDLYPETGTSYTLWIYVAPDRDTLYFKDDSRP